MRPMDPARSEIDGIITQIHRPNPAANTFSCFEHNRLQSVISKNTRRREACDTGTDYDDRLGHVRTSDISHLPRMMSAMTSDAMPHLGLSTPSLILR